MKSQYSDWTILKRMTLQARPYWLHIAGIFLLSVLSAPVALLAPLPLKIVIDNLIGSRPLSPLVAAIVPHAMHAHLLAFAVAMLIGVAVLTYVQGSGTWLLQT